MEGIASAIARPRSLAGVVVHVGSRLKEDIEMQKIILFILRARRNTSFATPAQLASGPAGHEKVR